MDSQAIEPSLARLSQALEGLAESRERLGDEFERSLSSALTLIESLDQIVGGVPGRGVGCGAAAFVGGRP